MGGIYCGERLDIQLYYADSMNSQSGKKSKENRFIRL